MKKLLYEIKLESEKLTQFNDEELKNKTEKIKKINESKLIDKTIVEWFAIVQETSRRTIGLKHFETQLLAGLLLHEGKIVEMKTGEGKTLVSTLPVSFNCLTKKGVHVVTVNDYLAERDQKWMGKIYEKLGLSVGLIKTTSNIKEKQESYNSDITYITNSELVFDYLRDSSAYNLNEIVQRPFNFCLIDEIDSILIDESRTPLILSSFKGNDNINKLYLAKVIANSLEKNIDFELDEKRKDINLTEKGYNETKRKLGKETLYDPDDPWILEILNALKAKYIFKLNKDYIVLNNKIVIVDEFTGRIMEDRRWSMGLHEAVEIKEKVAIGGGTKTKTSITYQNFFPLYSKLAGMTGTAKTAEKEFEDIYKLNVVVLPTVKPMLRKDLPDLVYQNELSKWKAVLKTCQTCFEKGQPILIGTSTIEKSEFLSDLFKISKIPHQLLNAKPENVTRESEIVAQAGERYAVTIATNMAGRGTDIILGGNPYFKVKEKILSIIYEEKTENLNEKELNLLKVILDKSKTNFKKFENNLKNLPYSLEECETEIQELYNSLYKRIYEKWENENKIVKELGGLFVLGTERHETRRIDNQLRGRAGRQGDPGTSQFLVSLEDELIKVFGGDSIKRWVSYLIQDENVPLESNLLTQSLENAQKKVELYNYDLRKNVFQYDDILNSQRKILFKARTELLTKNIYNDLFLRYLENSIDQENVNFDNIIDNELLKIEKFLNTYSSYGIKKIKESKIKISKNSLKNILSKEIWISYDIRFTLSNFYQEGFLKSTRSIIILSIIDYYWTEHIERMGYIRETINWRSYGQQNPLIEYNLQAFKSYELLFEEIRNCMIYYFLNNSINY